MKQKTRGIPVWVKCLGTSTNYKRGLIRPSECTDDVNMMSSSYEPTLQNKSYKFTEGDISNFLNSSKDLHHYISSVGKNKSQMVDIHFEDGNAYSICVKDILESDTVFGHRDNASLTYLNAPNLLENIACRYKESFNILEKQGSIYTFTGWLLIAVNPYCPLPSLYNEAKLNDYINKSITVVDPHPFAIAEAAYNAMLKQWASQSIIISGESGAGKTECSKHVLKYLAFISDLRHDSKNQGVEYRVLQTNPILEAFGNAKTVRNDNSSRFGKLMKLHFDRQGRMLGASIKTYLLAKSRVCHVPKQERNYHVFYWLCKGAWPNEREIWKLRPANQYRYLESIVSNEGATQFQELRNAMESIGLPRSTQQSIFRVLTAILTLGNITFDIGIRSDGVKDVTVFRRDHENEVETACELLGLLTPEAKAEFELVTTSKKIREARGNLSESQAKQTIDSLARSLYQLVFDYLVYRINLALHYWHSKPNTFDGNHTPRPGLSRTSTPTRGGLCSSVMKPTSRGSMASFTSNIVPISLPDKNHSIKSLTEGGNIKNKALNSRYIGVLDIFGFEDLKNFSPNNFEQLCINYANERLHNFFLHQLIGRDQQSYITEGLRPPEIQITDNREVCFAICGSRAKPGVFELLDEASLVPVVGSKDDFFCNKVNTKLVTATSVVVTPLKGPYQTKEFTIQHFAGDVTYTAEGFNERNVDILSNDLRAFLMQSCEPFISIELCATLRNPENTAASCCEKCGERRHSLMPKREVAPTKPVVTEDKRHGCVPFLARRSSSEASGHQIYFAPKAMPQSDICSHCGTPGTGILTTTTFDESEESCTDNDENVVSPMLRGIVDTNNYRNDANKNVQRRGRTPEVSRNSLGAYVRNNSKRVKGANKKTQLEHKARSLVSLFSIQVEGLMATLNRTSSFFIRCIKPNDEQKAGVFDRGRVLQQLETGGMIGVLELMKKGFPCRVSYSDLWNRYSSVLPDIMKSQMTPRDFTSVILMYIKTRRSDFEIGHTRAFFRFGALQHLEKINSITDKEEKEKIASETFVFWLKKKEKRSLLGVLCAVRLWISVKKKRLKSLSVAVYEYYWSVYIPRKNNKAATMIQKHWRGKRCRMELKRRKKEQNASKIIQRYWTSYIKKQKFNRRREASTKLQSWYRMLHVQQYYRKLRQIAGFLQSITRFKLLRYQYRSIRFKHGKESPTQTHRSLYHNKKEYLDRYNLVTESQDGENNRLRSKRRRSSLQQTDEDLEENETNEVLLRKRQSRASEIQLLTTPRFPSSQRKEFVDNDVEEGHIVTNDRYSVMQIGAVHPQFLLMSPQVLQQENGKTATPKDMMFYTPREIPTQCPLLMKQSPEVDLLPSKTAEKSDRQHIEYHVLFDQNLVRRLSVPSLAMQPSQNLAGNYSEDTFEEQNRSRRSYILKEEHHAPKWTMMDGQLLRPDVFHLVQPSIKPSILKGGYRSAPDTPSVCHNDARAGFHRSHIERSVEECHHCSNVIKSNCLSNMYRTSSCASESGNHDAIRGIVRQVLKDELSDKHGTIVRQVRQVLETEYGLTPEGKSNEERNKIHACESTPIPSERGMIVCEESLSDQDKERYGNNMNPKRAYQMVKLNYPEYADDPSVMRNSDCLNDDHEKIENQLYVTKEYHRRVSGLCYSFDDVNNYEEGENNLTIHYANLNEEPHEHNEDDDGGVSSPILTIRRRQKRLSICTDRRSIEDGEIERPTTEEMLYWTNEAQMAKRTQDIATLIYRNPAVDVQGSPESQVSDESQHVIKASPTLYEAERSADRTNTARTISSRGSSCRSLSKIPRPPSINRPPQPTKIPRPSRLSRQSRSINVSEYTSHSSFKQNNQILNSVDSVPRVSTLTSPSLKVPFRGRLTRSSSDHQYSEYNSGSRSPSLTSSNIAERSTRHFFSRPGRFSGNNDRHASPSSRQQQITSPHR